MNTLKSFLILSLATLCMTNIQAESNAPKDKYVVIKNNSDRDIFYLYVSPETSDEWEEDVLEDDVLLAGDEITINLYGYEECLFDIKAVYDNEEEEIRWDVNVCSEDVEFYGVESDVEADKYVVVSNYSNRDIFYLYVSPESSGDWEEDVLGEDVLLAGDDITINLYGYDECLFDIKAVYDNEETEISWDVNVCIEDVEFYGN